MKSFLFLTTLLLAVSPAAIAQDGAVAPPNASQPALIPFSPEEAQKELDEVHSLVSTTNLWEKRFDWKETGASTADVTAHARQLLGTDAPSIEIRGKDTNRSSFVLQQAPLGAVLCSLAELANDQVWVFAGHIVLAPESELTPEEKEAVANKMAGQWKQTNKWNAQPALEKVTLRVVVADMKTRLAAQGQTAPNPLPAPPTPQNGKIVQRYDAKTRYASYEIAFGDLSPISQQALQSLVDTRSSRMYGAVYVHGVPAPNKPMSAPASPQLGPNVRVCWDEQSPFQKTLFLRGLDEEKPQFGSMEWYVSQPPTIRPPQ